MLAIALGAACLQPVHARAAAATAVVLTVDGDISPATAEYINRGLREAEGQGANCAVLRLNTPGGLLTSTQRIVQAILASKVPVIVYVWPPGGHATSAGCIITLVAHVAAMSPSTSIGAAHPLFLPIPLRSSDEKSGPDIMAILAEKQAKFTAAWISALVSQRGRNAEWAVKSITQSEAVPADRAVELRVVDFVARDLTQCLEKAHGRKVEVGGSMVTLNTRGASWREINPSLRERIFFFLGNGSVASVLFLLGILGIGFEAKAPHGGAVGVPAAICLILAVYGLAQLPVNYVGLLLLMLGLVLLLAEVKVHSHGVFTVSGIVCLIIGTTMVVRDPWYKASLAVIGPTAGGLGLFFAFVLSKAVQVYGQRPATGREALVGRVAEARTELNPDGTVFAEGTLWSATAADAGIPKGSAVQIVEVRGLRLIVRPAAHAAQPGGGQAPR